MAAILRLHLVGELVRSRRAHRTAHAAATAEWSGPATGRKPGSTACTCWKLRVSSTAVISRTVDSAISANTSAVRMRLPPPLEPRSPCCSAPRRSRRDGLQRRRDADEQARAERHDERKEPRRTDRCRSRPRAAGARAAFAMSTSIEHPGDDQARARRPGRRAMAASPRMRVDRSGLGTRRARRGPRAPAGGPCRERGRDWRCSRRPRGGRARRHRAASAASAPDRPVISSCSDAIRIAVSAPCDSGY